MRRVRRELRLRDGFIVVVMFWFIAVGVGALPFILAEHPHLSLTDAMFESVSGLTTTGATVIRNLEELPLSILYYRQQLQWLEAWASSCWRWRYCRCSASVVLQLYRAGPGSDEGQQAHAAHHETAEGTVVYLPQA